MTEITRIDTTLPPIDVRELSKHVDWRSRLVEIPYYQGLNVRLAMIANALSIIGVQAGDPRTINIFDDLLGPPFKWPLKKAYGQGGISTCSMVALGLLRRLGVDHDGIMEGYVIASGMRVAHAYARTRGAFLGPAPGTRPLPGDIVDLCPYEGSADRSNHTETVIGYTPDGGTIICVAGGQVGVGRLQAITTTRRPWRDTWAGQREVYGWIDVERLLYRGPVMVPEGVIPPA